MYALLCRLSTISLFIQIVTNFAHLEEEKNNVNMEKHYELWQFPSCYELHLCASAIFLSCYI